MDKIIQTYRAIPDADLMLCLEHGVAYQADMSHKVAYDESYFSKCRAYEDQDIANKINAGRIAIVAKHFGLGACLDIGVGSGEFVRKRPCTWGVDVNPVAIQWLLRNGYLADGLSGFRAYTMHDVLEHVEEPSIYFDQMQSGSYLFVSIPIYPDIRQVRKSKHYRPGEHLYYHEEQGFIDWMAAHGFDTLERQTFEIEAGRDSIYSYALRKR